MFNTFNTTWIENQGDRIRLLGGYWCSITVSQMNDWEVYLLQNYREKLVEYLSNQSVYKAKISSGDTDIRLRNMADQLLTYEEEFYLIAKAWYESL